jgi:hypothetical protein
MAVEFVSRNCAYYVDGTHFTSIRNTSNESLPLFLRLRDFLSWCRVLLDCHFPYARAAQRQNKRRNRVME